MNWGRWATVATSAALTMLAAALPRESDVGNQTLERAEASVAPRLPLHFEANVGQAAPEVGFLSRSGGESLSLSPTAATVEWSGREGHARVRMQLVGADAGARQVGEGRLPTEVNDYTSQDSSRWLEGIPTYARVRTQDAYPGIDLVWHGRPGSLEYDFVVAPGADPARIRLGFDGARGLRLAGGELVVGTGGKELRHRAPRLYQEVGGRRRSVSGRFELGGDQVAFAVGPYDRSRPLIIDPVLAYSSYLGGGGEDRAADVAVDGEGNTYLVGTADLAPWSEVSGAAPSPRFGAAMAYHPGTAKAVLFGGRAEAGELLGDTWVFDGSAWAELAIPGPAARADASLALEPTTGQLVLFGGKASSGVLGDTWLFDGNAWNSPLALDTTPQARSGAAMAGFQVLGAQGVVLFGGRSGNGDLLGDTWVWNGLMWVIQSPSAVPPDRAEAAAATDGAGRAHVFGGKGEAGLLNDLWAWSGTTWERQADGATRLPPARRGAALVRDDAGDLRLVGGRAGTALLADRWVYRAGQPEPWTKDKKVFVPVPGPRLAAAVARHDGAGVGLLVGGKGSAGLLSDTWSFEPSSPPARSWVAKLDATRTHYITYLNVAEDGSFLDNGPNINIDVDAAGVAYIAGSTSSFALATTPGGYQPACKPNDGGSCNDAFAVVLAPSGTLRYATYLGGSRTEYLNGMAVGPDGTMYLAGRVDSLDFPTTSGAYQPGCSFSVSDQCADAFVAKLAPVGGGTSDLLYSTYFGGTTGQVLANAVAVDDQGAAYITGFTKSTQLPVTSGAYQPACAVNPSTGGCRDAFVAKLAPVGDGTADLRYSTYLGGGCCTVPGAASGGGGGTDVGRAIAVGPGATIYVAGNTGSTDFPITPGAFDDEFKCFSDFGCIGFVAVLTASGAGAADLRYSSYLGSGVADQFRAVVVDDHGRAVVAASTLGSSFPVKKAVQKTCGCSEGTPNLDAVVAKLDPSVPGDGSGRVSATNKALVFSTFLGGSRGDIPFALALDGSDTIYVVGHTTSPDFPRTSGALQSRHAGGADGFFSKITDVP